MSASASNASNRELHYSESASKPALLQIICGFDPKRKSWLLGRLCVPHPRCEVLLRNLLCLDVRFKAKRMSDSKRGERLDHLLSRLGYGSRSDVRVWARKKRILVGGEPIRDASERVDPALVRFDGEALDHPGVIRIRMNKPAGLVCSHAVEEGPSVYDLLPERWRQRRPVVATVGRLDKDTTGVLLLTDDGPWLQRWTSPKKGVRKIYEVDLNRDPDPSAVHLFASGEMMLPDETKPCLPATLQILGEGRAQIELMEGRYHQVKRMFAAVDCEVLRLHRRTFGDIEVNDLQPGEWAELPEAPVPSK
jgi:16S rRNA pseudouridine516 synthase